jgi:stringent starvation protein B
MDHSPPTTWAKHLIRAAIDYFTERHARACLVVDNALLVDGVLNAISREDDTDFIICVAPGFTTQLDFGAEELTIAVRFDACHHVMFIPYSSIRYVIAANAGGAMTDGQLNLISVPPVIYSGGMMRRRKSDVEAQILDKDSPVLAEVAAQPAQAELQLVRRQ